MSLLVKKDNTGNLLPSCKSTHGDQGARFSKNHSKNGLLFKHLEGCTLELVASCSVRKAPDVPWDVRDIAARQMTQNICVALDKFKNYIIILYTIL